MSFNTKNYQAQNGDEWVIGGKLTIKEGAEIKGLPSFSPCENQADSTATTIADLKADFNSLLEKLKSAGLMVADSE